MTNSYSTSRSSVLSILLPTKINGNFYGSFGAPWFRNYWIHDSMLSKDLVILNLPFCWWYRRPRHNNPLLDRMRLLSFWTFPVLRCPISANLNEIYLKIDDFAIYNDFFFHEVSTDGGLVWLKKLLIDIAGYNNGVTNWVGRFFQH